MPLAADGLPYNMHRISYCKNNKNDKALTFVYNDIHVYGSPEWGKHVQISAKERVKIAQLRERTVAPNGSTVKWVMKKCSKLQIPVKAQKRAEGRKKVCRSII